MIGPLDLLSLFTCAAAWIGHTAESREFAEDIVGAFKDADLKHDAAARTMGISGPQLSDQLAGRDPMNVWRLSYLPVEFHMAFVKRRAKRMGAEVLTADQIAVLKGIALTGAARFNRMLKMAPEIPLKKVRGA